LLYDFSPRRVERLAGIYFVGAGLRDYSFSARWNAIHFRPLGYRLSIETLHAIFDRKRTWTAASFAFGFVPVPVASPVDDQCPVAGFPSSSL
jgi:hypothetical protein